MLAIPGSVLAVWRRKPVESSAMKPARDGVRSHVQVERPLLLLLSFAALVIALGDGGPLHPLLFCYGSRLPLLSVAIR